MRLARWIWLLSGLASMSPSPSRAQDAQAQAALPTGIRQAGVLKVATSLQWPPFDYKSESGAPDGIDIRLMTLLAGRLGLKPQFDDIKFPSIVPGVASGRYDVGVDQIAITPERQKAADFVPYYNSGYGLLVRQGATDLDVNHLCGRTLVLTQGSGQIGVAEKLSADCQAKGEQAIAFIYFPNSADTYLALANGRGEGFMTDRAVGVYIAHHDPKLAMTSGLLPNQVAVSGIVVAKGNTALQTALLLALQSAVADGSYAAIMTDFGVPEGALTTQQIDAAMK